MSAPLIYKQAANLPKQTAWLNQMLGRASQAVSPYYRAAEKAVGGFKLNNPRFAMPLIGAGLGAYGNYKLQTQKVQRGEQEKVNLGNVAKSMGIGAGLGLGASYIKPVQRLWHRGFDLRNVTRPRQIQLATDNPLWLRQQTSRPKLFSADYFRELKEDFMHPGQSLKATLLNNRYKITRDPTFSHRIARRSLVGEGAMNIQNLLIPGYSAVQTIANKNMSPEEKATRLGTAALSTLTPKAVPQLILNNIPNFIPFRRKPTPEQLAMAEQLAAESEAAANERPPQTV